jgi:hypothetical protein
MPILNSGAIMMEMLNAIPTLVRPSENGTENGRQRHRL